MQLGRADLQRYFTKNKSHQDATRRRYPGGDN
jgi:hypothetical protein